MDNEWTTSAGRKQARGTRGRPRGSRGLPRVSRDGPRLGGGGVRGSRGAGRGSRGAGRGSRGGGRGSRGAGRGARGGLIGVGMVPEVGAIVQPSTSSLAEVMKVVKFSQSRDNRNFKNLSEENKTKLMELQEAKQVYRCILPDAPERKQKRKASPIRMPCPLVPGTPEIPPPKKLRHWEIEAGPSTSTDSTTSRVEPVPVIPNIERPVCVCSPTAADVPCSPTAADGPCSPTAADVPCSPTAAYGPCSPTAADVPCSPTAADDLYFRHHLAWWRWNRRILRMLWFWNQRTSNSLDLYPRIVRRSRRFCLPLQASPQSRMWSQETSKTFFYQIGVVSYGKKCAEANLPVVISRATHFVPWIEEKVIESRTEIP